MTISNGRLTILIDGREAIPVRAIPYVTGWQFSPDLVAQEFARTIGEPFAALRVVSSYHLPDSQPVLVLPREWDSVLAAVVALEAELNEDYENDAIGYEAWRKRSANRLPAGVMVWRDEFESAYRKKRGRTLFIEPKREGDDELILSPMLDSETRVMVMEGFSEKAAQANVHEDRWSARQFQDGFDSVRAPITHARKLPANLSDERCAELATKPSLKLSAFIELVGIGIGMHESYQVSSEGVAFRKWEEEYISHAPLDWQAEMNRDNEESPTLPFPCTPAELLQFIDTAIGIHCFSVPDAFRQAVTKQISRVPDTEPPARLAPRKCQRGITKAEILVAEWPMPAGAPRLESVLNKIPKWVDAACIKVGSPGKGRSGSHLWNPAMLAVCLATRTPHKNWTCKQEALTGLVRSSFSDYLEEWSEKQELL